MLRKDKAIAMTLAIFLLFVSVAGILSKNLKFINIVNAANEETQEESKHEYDDLYELRVEVTKNPTSSYFDTGIPDFSGLQLSVFAIDKSGNETEIMSDAALEEVKNNYDVNIIENPGGGTFTIIVSAYSTALSSDVYGRAEFFMEKIQNTNIKSLRAEIISIPSNMIKYDDADLDLSELSFSVWETYEDGMENEITTNADLIKLRERYLVDIICDDNDNKSEGTCTIKIYTYVHETEVSTTCKFTYTINETASCIKGDINADGEFNIADIVLLQKWLLGVTDTQIEDWKAADLFEDDRLDVFDLCLMKRELINSLITNEYPVENPEVIDEFTPCTKKLSDIQDPGKFYIVIKCQYSKPDRKWSIDDFNGIDNIKSITQSNRENPYRTVLEIKLKDQVAEKMLSMIQKIEELGLEEIKEFQFVNYATGVPE